MKLTVHLEKNSYPIYIEPNILTRAWDLIGNAFTGKRIFILSDDNVYPLYGEALKQTLTPDFECHELVLPHGETSKSFQSLPVVYNALLDAHLTRSDLILALGGGVVGDLAGFAAATYLRGVNLVQIPTSLLAQVDSSVGGKTAVDLPRGKNLVGAFCQPKLVLIDPLVLDSLPRRFINDGMGEVIKYGCIHDAALFQTLESHRSFDDLKEELPSVISCCVDIKRRIVEQDPFDVGERMLLNFGHTLAHAIEQYHHYEKESHGEAVSIGMYQITKLAQQQFLTPPGIAGRLLNVLNIYGLPHTCGIPVSELIKAMTLDKKNLDGHLNVVLLRDIGQGYIHPTTTEFFQQFRELV